MLVLMQYPGEPTIISLPSGELVRVIVGAVVGNRVRMCYDAPRHIPIDREKIYLRKQAESDGNG